MHVICLPVEILDTPLGLLLHLREELMGLSDLLLQLDPVLTHTLHTLWTGYGGQNTQILQ